MQLCLYIIVAMDDRFRALGNERRRAMLRLVRDHEQPVSVITEQLDMTQPAVSQHLAVLRDAGLVTVRADGRRRLYRADPAALAELQGFFDDYWSGAVDRLAEAAERAAAQRREAS